MYNNDMEKFLELIDLLHDYKYACKLAHWKTTNYEDHLLLDRLAGEDGDSANVIDGYIDNIAEQYFMAENRQSSIKIGCVEEGALDVKIDRILAHLEVMKLGVDRGVGALLDNIAQTFQENKGLCVRFL
jgi:hypothetical protein